MILATLIQKCMFILGLAKINDSTISMLSHLRHGKTGLPSYSFLPFSGCDSTSSLFNQGKCELWDKWHDFPDNEPLTRVFPN